MNTTEHPAEIIKRDQANGAGFRFDVGDWIYDNSGWHFWSGEIVARGTLGAKAAAMPIYKVKARNGEIEYITEQDAERCAVL